MPSSTSRSTSSGPTRARAASSAPVKEDSSIVTPAPAPALPESMLVAEADDRTEQAGRGGERLDVRKTYKLYIGGKFPRTESGRSYLVADAKGTPWANACRASRKDVRAAVQAARKAHPRWAGG